MDDFVVPNFILDCSDITQDKSWTIERIMKDRTPFGWSELFKNPGVLAAAKTIQKVIDEKHGGVYVPMKKDLFQAYHLTPLNQVKVCIIGMDPYPGIYNDGIPHATGVALSISKGRPIQPSLRNVFTEIKRCNPHFVIPDHGDLTGWCLQGCLMLNSSLTTSPGVVGAHGKIWRGFIKSTIEAIRLKNPHVVIVLMGKNAKELEKFCGSLTVFSTSHPSQNSAYFGDDAFMGSNIFNKINQTLISKNIYPINWNHLI